MAPPLTFLVEDSVTIRENLVSTLAELAGIKVVGMATTEDEATSWLVANPNAWQLLVVDLFLAAGSGLGILRACANRGAHQRVVVLTNYATAEIRNRCRQLGADSVFDKSTEIEQFLAFCLAA